MRATSLVCLGLMGLLLTGYPQPRLSPKDRSTPFPCMDSRCGCRTAEQCWKHCCCHTLEEKLAWAREHGVTPPDYILQKQIASAELQESSDGCDSCCREKAADSCSTCENGSERTQPSCSCAVDTDTNPEEDDLGWSWIPTLRARNCQGLDGWMLLLQCIPLDRITTGVFAGPLPSSEMLYPCDEFACSQRDVPETPPPRPGYQALSLRND